MLLLLLAHNPVMQHRLRCARRFQTPLSSFHARLRRCVGWGFLTYVCVFFGLSSVCHHSLSCWGCPASPPRAHPHLAQNPTSMFEVVVNGVLIHSKIGDGGLPPAGFPDNEAKLKPITDAIQGSSTA